MRPSILTSRPLRTVASCLMGIAPSSLKALVALGGISFSLTALFGAAGGLVGGDGVDIFAGALSLRGGRPLPRFLVAIYTPFS